MTDSTVHGGKIVVGMPTVLIGDGGGGGGGGGAGGGAVVTKVVAGANVGVNAAALNMARSLTKAGGTADAADAELVAQELAKLPPHMLKIMKDNNVKVVACRGSITDHETSLKGVQPRGWPPGSTWDSVPGMYMPNKNEVVVATVGHGTSAGAHVPQTGEGHGSANVVLHEAGHSVDRFAPADKNSSSAAFNSARTKDFSALSSYQQQAGAAGQEETYAESIAHSYGGDANYSTTHPNLANHWASDPFKP
jgi:hypothetical protein